MTRMLASVNSLDEALLVLNAKVDIIDLKEPAAGALGALDTEIIKYIMTAIKGRCPVSATIGDLPMRAEVIVPAVEKIAATGVDYIKIGFFPNGDSHATIKELAKLTQNLNLIAVLFADTQPDFSLVGELKNVGFKGVMLDTKDKHKGKLTKIMLGADLSKFVELAKKMQLMSGLAGSLTIEDVPVLLGYCPDYLGFRGGLCEQRLRTGQLDTKSILAIKTAIQS